MFFSIKKKKNISIEDKTKLGAIVFGRGRKTENKREGERERAKKTGEKKKKQKINR